MARKKGPWTVLSSRIAYQTPWVRVVEDKVLRPDGKPGIYSVIIPKSGSSVIAMDDNRNVFLTKEYHYAVEKVTLEAVNGGRDGQETYLAVAKRELQEEAGISAKKWTALGFVHAFTSFLPAKNYMYLAEGLTHGSRTLEGTEIIEIVKMPFTKALKFVEDGAITHGATVTALLKIEKILAARDARKKK